LNHIIIDIYTDGSCNNELGIGAWVALVNNSEKKIILKGEAIATTHNRMELAAAINAINFVKANYPYSQIKIFTDSQYLYFLPKRKEKLQKNQFKTRRDELIKNYDLVIMLINQMEVCNIEFIKIKAHQKAKEAFSNKSVLLNIEVDKMVRKMVREMTQTKQ
jgi:ribonuclease HI